MRREQLSIQARMLLDRGITKEAHAAQWQKYTHLGRPGWRYPVFDYTTGATVGVRWKAADGGQPKYLWLPSKPKNPAAAWYVLPGIRAAIAAAGGVCYLANGEPSLLAYLAAGVSNVITTTLSETSVPGDVVMVLQAMGITHLRYPVDNDQAGKQSALNWRNALLDSTIYFEPLEWPPGTPAKGDANDLWILVEKDRAIFQGLLAELEPLKLPAPEIKPVTIERREVARPKDTPDWIDWDTWRLRWWAEVVLPAVEKLAGKRHGKHFRCINPNHEDRNPSARISYERNSDGLYVCTCSKPSRETVGEWAGAPDFMTWWHEQNPTPPGTHKNKFPESAMPPDAATLLPDAREAWDALPSLAKAEAVDSDLSNYRHSVDHLSALDWSGGLREGELSVVCAVCGLNGGVIVYATVTCGQYSGVTVDDLVAATWRVGLPLSADSIRRFLKSEPGQRLFAIFGSKESDKDLHQKIAKNPIGGRPQLRYSLLPPHEFEQALLKMAARKIAKWASGTKEYGRLPVQFRVDMLEPLFEQTDDVQAIVEMLGHMTETAKEADPKFARLLALFESRYKKATEWLSNRLRNAGLLGDSFSLDEARKLIQEQPESGEVAPAYVLGVALLRSDWRRNPRQEHTWDYDYWLTGVSDISRLRELARLQYEGGKSPRQTVAMPHCQPNEVVEKVNIIARQIGGKPLTILQPNHKPLRYTEENITRAMNLAVRQQPLPDTETRTQVRVIYSTSAPLEEKPAPVAAPIQSAMFEQEQTAAAAKPDATQQAQTEKASKPHRRRVDSDEIFFSKEDAIEALAEMLARHGWVVFDKPMNDPDRELLPTAWRDREGQLWPVHFETLYAAATGINVKAMLQIGRDYQVHGDEIVWLAGKRAG